MSIHRRSSSDKTPRLTRRVVARLAMLGSIGLSTGVSLAGQFRPRPAEPTGNRSPFVPENDYPYFGEEPEPGD